MQRNHRQLRFTTTAEPLTYWSSGQKAKALAEFYGDHLQKLSKDVQYRFLSDLVNLRCQRKTQGTTNKILDNFVSNCRMIEVQELEDLIVAVAVNASCGKWVE